MYGKIDELISKTASEIMIVFEENVGDDIGSYNPIFDYENKRLNIRLTRCGEEKYSINIFVDYMNYGFVYITYLDGLTKDMGYVERKIEKRLSEIGLR